MTKILEGHYHGRPPFINIGGHVPLSHRDRRPCPRINYRQPQLMQAKMLHDHPD